MTGASEDGGGDGPEASRGCHFAEPALLHEARAGCGGWVAGVEADELFEVGEYEAKGPAGTKIGEDVPDGDAKLVEGHVLKDMGAVDYVRGLRRDGETFDDVAVPNVFGIGRKALFHQQRGEKGKPALQPKGWTSVEI
jgi:hypothetical protein